MKRKERKKIWPSVLNRSNLHLLTQTSVLSESSETDRSSIQKISSHMIQWKLTCFFLLVPIIVVVVKLNILQGWTSRYQSQSDIKDDNYTCFWSHKPRSPALAYRNPSKEIQWYPPDYSHHLNFLPPLVLLPLPPPRHRLPFPPCFHPTTTMNMMD